MGSTYAFDLVNRCWKGLLVHLRGVLQVLLISRHLEIIVKLRVKVATLERARDVSVVPAYLIKCVKWGESHLVDVLRCLVQRDGQVKFR